MDSTSAEAHPDATVMEFIQTESSSRDVNQSVNAEATRASSFGEYKMTHGDRGHAVLFNNREFEDEKLNERLGTDMDLKRMLSVLKDEFGFKKKQIKSYHNVKKEDMKQFIVEAAAKDYSDCDCFVCVILSYGTRSDEIYGADGKPISLAELVEPFKGKPFQASQTLVGKPKIFFIQACPYEEGIQKREDRDSADSSDDEEDKDILLEGPVRIPSEADFFIACSSMPGSLTSKGSHFIQTLHKVLKADHNKDDLLSMLTKVINKVVEKVGDKDDAEVPCVKSMLTKKVFFRNAPQ